MMLTTRLYLDKQVDALGSPCSMQTSTDVGGHFADTFELCSFSSSTQVVMVYVVLMVILHYMFLVCHML